MPISDNDRKSELSYAYLHGVAAQAACECHISQRLSDNQAIDARLHAAGVYAPAPSLKYFDILVQLKATSQQLPVVKRNKRNCWSFRLEKSQYDKMRTTDVKNLWILVLLIVPDSSRNWLRTSTQALTLKKCAYWVSLREAPPPPDGPDDKLTIYIPQRNRFTPEALQKLLVRCAQEDLVTYAD